MNIYNNNSSIHQSSTCEHASARTRKGPLDELMKCGISNPPEPACWECRFFETSIGLDRDQPPADECQDGECRRHPPVTDHGRRDASVNYAEFPIVIACDWCGEFEQRTRRQGHEDRVCAAQQAKPDEQAYIREVASEGQISRSSESRREKSRNGR